MTSPAHDGHGGGPSRTLDEAALRAEQAQLRRMIRTHTRAARLRTISLQLTAISRRSPRRDAR